MRTTPHGSRRSKRNKRASTPAATRPPTDVAAPEEVPESPVEQPAASDETGTPERHDPVGGCLLRVFWLMLGNVALLTSAYGIVEDSAAILGPADLLYWSVAALLLGARYADIRYFQGRTADGRPASMAHWRRYAAVLAVVSTAIWLAAHAASHLSGPGAAGE